MPYSETQANRIREFFFDRDIVFEEKKMFMGICFMVDGKLCCGTHTDKQSGEEQLLCRIGEEAYALAIERDDSLPMDMKGREMKGYILVTEDGFRKPKDLAYWLQLCLDFNPQAKRSKK